MGLDKSSYRNRIKNIASISEANKDESQSPQTRSALRKRVKEIAVISKDNNGRMTPGEVGKAIQELQNMYLSKKGGSRRMKKTKGKRKKAKQTKRIIK